MPCSLCMQLQKKEEAHREAVDTAVAAMDHWMERFDVVVIGPGLGRDELVHQTVIRVRPPCLLFLVGVMAHQAG